jgi:hypothetical protein
MSRRRSAPINRHEDGNRTSIGDFYVNEAVKRLDRCALIEMNLMEPARFGRRTLMRMLFPDSTVEKLEAVRGMVEPFYTTKPYNLMDDIEVVIDWKDDMIPAPEKRAMVIDPARAEPFLAAVKSMSQIREKYAAVGHVLRWLNRNVTPAAVRALWPPVLTLCPNSPMCKEYADMPARWTAPAEAGGYAALLRETAGTVAGTQLLPSDLEPRERSKTWLTFAQGEVTREGITFQADMLTVNL